MPAYNTNLAAEYHVLSVLYRLGAEATLTVGYRKAVDIVVVRDAGDAVTIDVKGLAGITSWPVNNFRGGRKGHFLVFVCFRGKISDPNVSPEVYIVPSQDVPSLTYRTPEGKRPVFKRGQMLRHSAKYKDAWHLLAHD